MEWLLFTILILLIFINRLIIKDWFHPTIVLKIVWCFSTFVLLCYNDRWGVHLSMDTVLIFLGGVVFFDLGFFFLSITKLKINTNKTYNKISVNPKNTNLLLSITIIISLYLVFQIVRVSGSNIMQFDSFFSSYRFILKYSTDIWITIQQYLFRILEALAVCVFALFVQSSDLKKREKYKLISVLLLIILMELFTTDRYRFLAITVQFFFVYLVALKKRDIVGYFSKQSELLKKAIRWVMIFIGFFFLYGKFAVNKIKDDPLNNIALYIAGSLPAFDMMWKSFENTSQYFGQVIFSAFYNIAGKVFGIGVIADQDIERGVMPSVYGNNGFGTNVFTFYERQIRDFGVSLIPVIMFCLGMFIYILKSKSDSESGLGFWTVTYSTFMFAIVISFFQDAFFMHSTFTIIQILVYFFFFKSKLFMLKTARGDSHNGSIY